MTTIRTSNWDSMMDFYSRVLGMEPGNRDFRFIVSLRGLNSEILLERVADETERELLGRLEFETNEAGFDRFFSNRKTIPFELRSGNSFELVFRDPDGNPVFIGQGAAAEAA